MSKTIWYINHHGGGPGINRNYRAYELAREWQNQGCKAHVFIGNYAVANQDKAYPAYQLIDGVPYTAISTLKFKSLLGRILSMFIFAFRLNFIPRHLPKDAPSPDAIIISTVHPFGIFAGRRLAQKYKAKLVFEIRDFWPLTLIELLKSSRWNPFVMMCAFTERYAFKHADLVTSVLPRADLYFEDFNFKVAKYAWTPMGVSLDGTSIDVENKNFSEEYERAKQFIERSHADDKTVVVYAGAMGPPNNVGRLISALEYGKNTSEFSQITLLVIGEGVERAEIERRTKELPDFESYFTGMINKDEARGLLNKSDIGYAGGNNIPKLYRYGIAPNKIASYLGVKLAVLLPMEPCGDPVSESNCGISDAAETPKELWEILKRLVLIGKDSRQEMGENGHKYLLENLGYPSIARNYISYMFE